MGMKEWRCGRFCDKIRVESIVESGGEKMRMRSEGEKMRSEAEKTRSEAENMRTEA